MGKSEGCTGIYIYIYNIISLTTCAMVRLDYHWWGPMVARPGYQVTSQNKMNNHQLCSNLPWPDGKWQRFSAVHYFINFWLVPEGNTMEIAGESPFIEIRVIFLTIAHSRDREYYEMSLGLPISEGSFGICNNFCTNTPGRCMACVPCLFPTVSHSVFSLLPQTEGAYLFS